MDPIKPLESGAPLSDQDEQIKNEQEKKNLLLPGLAALNKDTVHDPSTDPERRMSPSMSAGPTSIPNNPPVLTHGRIQDNDLTNQDGQPLENNKLTTGFTDVAGDGPAIAGETVTGDPTNASMPVADEKFKAVKDHVSGNTVIVRNRNIEDKRAELQELMKKAHDSLGDAQIGDIGTGHPYWGLQEQARRFGKEHGLL